MRKNQIFRYSCLFAIGMVYFWSLPTLATERTCFGNLEEYQNSKSQLPALFQELPVRLVVSGAFGQAAALIRPAGNKIKLEYITQSGQKVDKDEAYLQSVCFQGNRLVIKGEPKANKPEDQPTIKGEVNGSSLKVSKKVLLMNLTIELHQASKENFGQFVEKIYRQYEGSETPSIVNSIQEGTR